MLNTVLLGGLAYIALSCLAGLAVAAFLRAGKGPQRPEKRSEAQAGAPGTRCCDGEFCGAWETCKESSLLG